MAYRYRISHSLGRILEKLHKKDKSAYEQIMNKIEEVISSPDVEHYKNLKYGLKDRKRVHIGHFVLVFKFNEADNLIEFVDFDHHDNVYQR